MNKFRKKYQKQIRYVLMTLVILGTIAAFTWYLRAHPEVIRQFRTLPPLLIAELLALYGVFLLILAWIQRATLRLCRISLPPAESMLLVSYAAIINFFGPLQSGPAFRAAYLKKRYDVSLKRYTLATLLYYGCFASFSGLFILSFFIGPWVLLGIAAAFLVLPLALRRPGILPKRFQELDLQAVSSLVAGSLAQVMLVAFIFFVELNSLGNRATALQTLVYTGSANFALFVSITPGAIGFREAFVAFTKALHHIPGGQQITASLIDRAVYILYLGILAIFVFGLHARQRLMSGPSDKSQQGKVESN